MKNWITLGLLGLFLGCLSSSQEDKVDKANYESQITVVQEYIALQKFGDALKLLRNLQRIEDTSTIQMFIGFSCLGIGNNKCAARAYRKAYSMNKDNFDALLNFGYTLILLERFPESRKVFDKIVKDGHYAYMERVYVNLGLSFLEEKQPDKAIPYFKKALELDPTLVAAHYNAGRGWVLKKSYKKASSAFQKAVDFCPGCLDPEIELAKSLYREGKRQKAVTQLEKLLHGNLSAKDQKRTKRLLAIMKR